MQASSITSSSPVSPGALMQSARGERTGGSKLALHSIKPSLLSVVGESEKGGRDAASSALAGEAERGRARQAMLAVCLCSERALGHLRWLLCLCLLCCKSKYNADWSAMLDSAVGEFKPLLLASCRGILAGRTRCVT